MPARGARLGCWLGGARRGRAVGASAAPCSADFDPPRRTAPARRGAAGSPAPWPFPARGWWSRRPPPPGDRARRGRGGGRVRAYCFLALPLTVYVFSWELSVWSGACIAGGGGGTSAPGAVTSTGRRPGASEAGPAAGARFAAQLWSALGNFCPPPAGPIFRKLWGFPASSHPGRQRRAGAGGGSVEGLGTPCGLPPTPVSARPPAPPPCSRSLRKLRP